MINQMKDPELVNDQDIHEVDNLGDQELPEYDPSQFELPDDFEYTEDDEDGN